MKTFLSNFWIQNKDKLTPSEKYRTPTAPSRTEIPFFEAKKEWHKLES